MLQAALSLHKKGFRPIPIVAGTKKAAIKWDGESAVMPSEEEVRSQFSNGSNIAVQSGIVSGNLECIDFDDPDCFEPWRDLVVAYGLEESLGCCYVQTTPSGGYHVIYRVTGPIPGNQKLASQYSATGSKSVRIETRADGGYFLIAPTQGYKALPGCSWSKLEPLGVSARNRFIEIARTFDRCPKKPYTTSTTVGDVKPGKDFDQRTSWADVLEPHGWKSEHRKGSVEYWTRPGKKDGISATTGYAGTDLLYVFSSNASPFEPDATYSKFAAYAFLHHGGDFSEAAKDLSKRGYGSKQTDPTPVYKTDGPGPDAPRRKTLADFEPETARYLFDDWRYLRTGNNNLFDAKGGSGKTTLILCVAAMASNGMSPTGQRIEPFKTLYYGSEDSGGELRTVFESLGGRPEMFVYVDDQLCFDDDGLETLDADLYETRARLFVLDAAKYYLPGRQGAEFDGPTVARFCAGLRDAARRYDCASWLVRHFTRHTKDRDLLDQGAGLSQWYDSCRSVMVALKHPERAGNSVVWQTKGSIVTQTNPPFGVGYTRGQYGFWQPTDEDFALFGMDEDGRKRQDTGRPSVAIEEAKQFLCDILRDGPKRINAILDEADVLGLKRATVYRAAEELRIKKSAGVWKLFDPYDD